MRHVILFPLQPWWLAFRQAIGAAFDDLCDLRPELPVNVEQSFFSARIFDGIMEQGSDRLGFIRAVLQGDCGYAKNVSDVRDFGFFPKFPAVN